jgi:hypothetical protein
LIELPFSKQKLLKKNATALFEKGAPCVVPHENCISYKNLLFALFDQVALI